MITQALNLNLIPGQVLPRVNVSQYDSGTRTLQMSLYNGTQTFNVTSGVLAFIQGTKPDRTGFQYSATVTTGSNVVTADITQQMTAVSGDVVTELVLVSGDDQIATVNFIIHVEPAALADDTVLSDTELPLIEEAAELAERIDGIIAQIDADADKSEAYAVGTKGGTPVPSTDPTYHNNSKYYSEQAAASAASIGDLAEAAEAWAVGTRDGSAVPSTDPAYHNNSKYYAQDAGDKATAAGTSANSASTDALKAEGFAVGEQNGTAVTSGSPYYHNNAEYFAGEASTSATNASTSETNAGLSESAAAQSEEDSEAWAVGERNGVPVTSGDPTYQNNAKYYAQQAGGTALSSLVDVAISGATNGQVLAYNSTSTKWENEALANIFDKRYIIITDSYGSYDDGDGNSFIELMRSYLGLSANSMIDIHKGSSGFTKTGVNKWLTMLEEQEGNIDAPDTITDIWCIGGANDIGSTSAAIETAISEFVSYCESKYINAKITTAFPGIIISNDYTNRDIAISGYKTVVKYGGHYLDNSEYILKRFGLIRTQDNVHPNNSGVITLAQTLANATFTGMCDVFYTTTPTVYTLIGGTLTSAMYQNRKNGVVEVSGTRGNLLFSIAVNSATSINQNTALCKLTDDMWFGGASRCAIVDVFIDGNFSAPVPAIIYVSDVNTDGTVTIKISFYDGGGRSINSSIAIYGRNTYVE